MSSIAALKGKVIRDVCIGHPTWVNIYFVDGSILTITSKLAVNITVTHKRGY